MRQRPLPKECTHSKLTVPSTPRPSLPHRLLCFVHLLRACMCLCALVFACTLRHSQGAALLKVKGHLPALVSDMRHYVKEMDDPEVRRGARAGQAACCWLRGDLWLSPIVASFHSLFVYLCLHACIKSFTNSPVLPLNPPSPSPGLSPGTTTDHIHFPRLHLRTHHDGSSLSGPKPRCGGAHMQGQHRMALPSSQRKHRGSWQRLQSARRYALLWLH